jgi:hypothetical protein
MLRRAFIWLIVGLVIMLVEKGGVRKAHRRGN